MTGYAEWRSRLAEANDPQFWPIEYIDQLLVEGRAQFWAGGESALITQLVTYPGGARTIEAIAGAGTKEGLATAISPAVEREARAANLTHMKALGRPGWARTLKPIGWRLHQEILIKDLADG